MSVSATSGSTPSPGTSATQSAATANLSNKTLGQDAFLRLMMTELQNQDPTSPMDNEAFITQMATFNSLQQLTSINAMVTSMDGSLKTLNQLLAVSLAGTAANALSGASGGTK